MSDTIGDPFAVPGDPSNNQGGGLFGQSPSFWQHLAMFGGNLAASANARTPGGFLANGTGFAGPFGAAIGQTYQQSNAMARNQAMLGSENAEMRTRQLQNRALEAQLPVQELGAQQSLEMMQQYPPAAMMGQMGAAFGQGAPQPFGGGYGASGIGGIPGGDAWTQQTMHMEGGPSPNPRSSASGYGQLTDENKAAFANANPSLFQGVTDLPGLRAKFDDPKIGGMATDWLRQQNTATFERMGIEPSGPNLGMAHRIGATAAAAVTKAPDQMPLADVLQASIGPQETQKYLTANPGMGNQTVGGFRQQFAGLPTPGFDATMGTGIRPQDALAQSKQLDAMANQLEMRQSYVKQMQARGIMLPMPPGDPTMIRQRSATLLNYALAGPQAGAQKLGEQHALLQTQPTLESRIETAKRQADITTAAPLSYQTKLGEDPLHVNTDKEGNMYIGDGMGGKINIGRGSRVEESIINGIPVHSDVGGIGIGDLRNLGVPINPNANNPNRPAWMGQAGATPFQLGGQPVPGAPGISMGPGPSTDPNAPTLRGPSGMALGEPPRLQSKYTPGEKIESEIGPESFLAGNRKAYEDFAGKETDAFHAANNTQGLLTQMQESARVLNQAGGFLGTGPTAPERLAFAAKVNDYLRVAGSKAIFDPNAVGAWEELGKATKTAGFELSTHYEGHARQAAQTIENAMSSVPGEPNSPVGFQKVFAGIGESTQAAIDMHNAKTPVYNNHGNLVDAENTFVKNFPATMYSQRAISTITPYPIKDDSELPRYLPGTFLVYKGNLIQAPPRNGWPPIPDYIKAMHQAKPITSGALNPQAAAGGG